MGNHEACNGHNDQLPLFPVHAETDFLHPMDWIRAESTAGKLDFQSRFSYRDRSCGKEMLKLVKLAPIR